MISRRSTLKGLALGAATLATGAIAQDARSPITLLVGAASSMDFTARLMAEELRGPLGRPVVVLSKLGAAGRLALGELQRAAPDGRTLMLSTSSPFAIFPNIYTNLPYDPEADFTPIAGVTWFDVGVATGPQIDAKDIKAMFDWVRQQPPGAIYGSAPGNGSLSHFVGIAMALESKVTMTHVPYKDSGVGVSDLIAGRIPIFITGLAPLLGMHRAGRIRIVGNSGPQRAPVTPDVPTLKESGLNISNFNSVGLFGPAKLPRDIVEQIHKEVGPILARADVKEKLAAQGMSVHPLGPQELAASLKADRAMYAGLVAKSGYKPEPL